jgi:hypothetical protein
MAPAGTPGNVVALLNREFNAALAILAEVTLLAAQGFEPGGESRRHSARCSRPTRRRGRADPRCGAEGGLKGERRDIQYFRPFVLEDPLQQRISRI